MLKNCCLPQWSLRQPPPPPSCPCPRPRRSMCRLRHRRCATSRFRRRAAVTSGFPGTGNGAIAGTSGSRGRASPRARGYTYVSPTWHHRDGRWYFERGRWNRGDRDRDGVSNRNDRFPRQSLTAVEPAPTHRPLQSAGDQSALMLACGIAARSGQAARASPCRAPRASVPRGVRPCASSFSRTRDRRAPCGSRRSGARRWLGRARRRHHREPRVELEARQARLADGRHVGELREPVAAWPRRSAAACRPAPAR